MPAAIGIVAKAVSTSELARRRQVAGEREDHGGDEAADGEQHRRGDEPLELQALLAARAAEAQHERGGRERDARQRERPAEALERVRAVDRERVGEPVDRRVRELARARARRPPPARRSRPRRATPPSASARLSGRPSGNSRNSSCGVPNSAGRNSHEPSHAAPTPLRERRPAVRERRDREQQPGAAEQPADRVLRAPRGDERADHREREQRERDDEIERRRHVVGGDGQHPAGEQHRHGRRAHGPREPAHGALLSHSETWAGCTRLADHAAQVGAERLEVELVAQPAAERLERLPPRRSGGGRSAGRPPPWMRARAGRNSAATASVETATAKPDSPTARLTSSTRAEVGRAERGGQRAVDQRAVDHDVDVVEPVLAGPPRRPRPAARSACEDDEHQPTQPSESSPSGSAFAELADRRAAAAA